MTLPAGRNLKSVLISDSAHKLLRQLAAEEGATMRDVFERAIYAYAQRKGHAK